MMLKLKAWAISVLGVISAILLALVYRGKAKHEKSLREASEGARETEAKAVEALIDGLQKEREAINEIDTIKRDHFSS